MTSSEYAVWTGDENHASRLERLHRAFDTLAGPQPGWPTSGDPRRPRLKAILDAADRLELTKLARDGVLARQSFERLTLAKRAELAEEVFKVMEFRKDGTPGNDAWDADTTMDLGIVFARYDVKFTADLIS